MRILILSLAALAAHGPAWGATYEIFFEVGDTSFSDSSGNVYDISASGVPATGFVPELITVRGTIETDGSTGMLQGENIRYWSISLEDSSRGIDFAFDSDDPVSYFEIDYKPPGNLGPIASEDSFSIVIGGQGGTEMAWQYAVWQGGYLQYLYEVSIGPDLNEVQVRNPTSALRYETNYFGTGISSLEIGSRLESAPQPPAVPLPSSVLMILAGVGGLAWMGRRRSSAGQA